jgi:hypothetical protein
MSSLIFDEVAWRLDENQIYGQIVEELKQGQKDEALWLKALAEVGGSSSAAEAQYVLISVKTKRDIIIQDILELEQEFGERKTKKILKGLPTSPIRIREALFYEKKKSIGKKFRGLPAKNKLRLIDDPTISPALLPDALNAELASYKRDQRNLLLAAAFIVLFLIFVTN